MPTRRSTRSSRQDFTEISEVLHYLCAQGDLEPACVTIEHGLTKRPPFKTQEGWVASFEQLPAEVRAVHPQAAWISIRLYTHIRRFDLALIFAEQARKGLSQADFAPLIAYEALSLTSLGHHQQALDVLAPVLDSLSGLAAGTGWRARGQAMNSLRQEGWQEAFVQAGTLLQGRPLGLLLLEQGGALERIGQSAYARDLWRQALPLLQDDPVYVAWLRHALGNACLRFALPEAEDHFLAMEQAVRDEMAALFRPWAACGLATARLAQGEWARALSGYRRGVRLAQEPIDQRLAWRGVGYTQRLMGKPELALETFQKAAAITPEDIASGTSWVFVDIAACYAQIGRPEEAWAALERTGPMVWDDEDRGSIVRAALAYQAGDLAEATRQLASVHIDALWVREEAHCFPDLFDACAPRRPVPLSYSGPLRVEVHALGPLLVKVNGRPVPLRPTGRAGELLVLLLEQGNRAATEVLGDLLYPEGTQKRSKSQAVWGLVRELRETLGWEESVLAQDGVYQLDPEVQWWYDVREALARGEATPQFLSGNYQAWVVERGSLLALRES
ncbi:tetratricopeptide repeat protein [uncultured Deinococcus sp.]|uniref:tetratricopeptide repeat protein n=1 Tax=uncultured Deinococcus sp. TaxID=158789 RepID=UPI00259093EA|nr:tetratricopeptide repeat protein [uncultured Deinococcus sp.]